MRKIILFIVLLASIKATAQQFKVVTIVESIVPAGIGRSRIVETVGTSDVEKLTTQREGNKSNQGDVSRSDVKVSGENMKETKLVNFFSIGGINFGNIASNDAVIEAKLNELVKEGWTVAFVTSGVESDAGTNDGQGIFITRIFLTKP